MDFMTLSEYAKTLPEGDIRRVYIEIFGANPLMEALGFTTIQGNAIKYDVGGALPGVGFRGINEDYDPTIGIMNPQVETTFVAGGEIKVDQALVKVFGPGRRSVEEERQLTSLMLAFVKNIVKGDSTVDPRLFDGLQRRINGNQLHVTGTVDGGAALSLGKLDRAIAGCYMPTHLLMNIEMKLKLDSAKRSSSVMGNINYTPGEAGLSIPTYNGIPIIVAGTDNEGDEIIDFTETNPGAATFNSATCTSIYVISVGPTRLEGIQSSPPDVWDFGVVSEGSYYKSRIEWIAGMMIQHPKAAVRLAGISDAAITA
jgi:hypothetical protein